MFLKIYGCCKEQCNFGQSLGVIREIDDEMVRMSFLMRCRSVFLLHYLLPMFESRSYLNQYPTMNAICYNVQ